MNIYRIIAILIFLIPIFKGILNLIFSKNLKFSKFAKFKESENYEYKNKTYSTACFGLGGAIGFFCIMLTLLFEIFTRTPKNLLLPIIIILVENIFIDTFTNVRFQIDEYDKEHNNENKD